MELIQKGPLSVSLLGGSHQPYFQVKLSRIIFARFVRLDFDREVELSENELRLSEESIHNRSSDLVDGSPEGAREGSDGSQILIHEFLDG